VHARGLLFASMSRQPILPMISVVAFLFGAVLVLGREAFVLTRRCDELPGTRSQRRVNKPFLTTVWFGMVAGWLEVTLVLAQRAGNPHVSVDSLRTNQHFVWMIPVSDVLIFSVVGLSIALLARFRPGLAHWMIWRVPIGLSFLTWLLTVEGLTVTAAVSLSCGLACNIGPYLENRTAAQQRLIWLSFPILTASLVLLTAVTSAWVTSAEDRALSQRPPAKLGVPNVLLIVLDTVRAANLSLYGYDRLTTPNLEKLARKGIVFSEARSTAPWTLPSHASMMTGRWPHELSVGADRPLDEKFPTLAEELTQQGYATAGFVGNTVYCNARYGVGRGFARYEDMYENRIVSLFETVRSSGLGRRVIQVLGYPISYTSGNISVRKTAEMLNRDVLTWLAGRPAGEPFFAFVNYLDAHSPYDFQKTAAPRFGLAALPLADHRKIDKQFWALAEKPVLDGFSAEQTANEGYALFQDSYDSCIAYLDHQIGLLINEIERRGLMENTLLIVTSDHGEHFGEHGLIGHGNSLYRREVHVPLVVIPPGRSSIAKIIDEPVSVREIPATVAEWVDLGPQNPFPGRSLRRFLRAGAERLAQTSPVLCEVQQMDVLPQIDNMPSTLGPVVSLVSRERVYIRSHGVREELYDLVHDPLESVDLARYPESRPVIDRFREELRRFYPGGSDLAK
jgi:arylsulfatase A-like enzyme